MPKKGEQVFSPRDNTRTRFVPEVGFQPERKVRRRDVRLDDGISGYLPVVGDILQAGQAILDLRNKEYGKAALGAGMLLLPNVLDKPIKQVLKNGVERVLRREPGMALHLFDADHPYRGTNFLHHGTAYSDDILGNAADGVLEGETRAMSPSFAINRIGDFNDISTTPGRYWDAFFVGDKSLLDDAIIYRGDGNTPVLSDVYVNPTHLFGSIPSAARGEAAERLWQNTLSGPRKGSGPTITVPDLDVVDQPDIKYFEAKIHGTVPLDKMRHGVFLDPKYSDNPKKAEKVIQAYSDRGLPVSLYNGTRDGWAETYLDILNNNPDILFKCGGQMNKYPGGGRFFKAGDVSVASPGTLLTVPSFSPRVSSGPAVNQLDLGENIVVPSVVVDQNPPVSLGNPAAPLVIEGVNPHEPLFDMSKVRPFLDYNEMKLRQRYAESGFRDNLTSRAGAKGRYQIMPITLQEYTNKTGKTGDLMDAAFNEGLRDWYMDEALPKYNAVKRGNPTDLIREYRKYAAYNMGPGALNKALTKAEKAGIDIDNTTDWVKYLPKETRDYVNFIVGQEDIADTARTKLKYEAAKRLRGVKEYGGSLYDYSAGGDIHIAPSKKGTFTAAASRHGKSVQAFASQVLANKENYSPAMVRKANFARNAAKWHHSDGGFLDRFSDYDPEMILNAIRKVKQSKI